MKEYDDVSKEVWVLLDISDGVLVCVVGAFHVTLRHLKFWLFALRWFTSGFLMVDSVTPQVINSVAKIMEKYVVDDEVRVVTIGFMVWFSQY